MAPEKQSLTSTVTEDFSYTEITIAEKKFPVKDDKIAKLDVTDLFAYFTANIIKEDTLFVR